MKFIFLSVILLISTHCFAANSDCEAFIGRYSKQVDNNDTYSVQGLEIKFDKASATLEIKYNSDLPRDQWNGWFESYIADGKAHQGDKNTGLYTLSCNGNEINIHRVLPELTSPLINVITLQGDQLYFLNYVEGAQWQATHMQLKKN